VRLLTPTENRRLNETVGFLSMAFAVLIALALLSYSPHDASFNVAAQAPDGHPASNWIGLIGAYSADAIFQTFGYAAFLLPMGIFALGLRWLRSQALDSPLGKLIGYALLVITLPALLALWNVPNVRGAIPPGGLFGTVLAEGLRGTLNSVGAHVVALALFLAALTLTTRFSFVATHGLLQGPVKRLDVVGRVKARWTAWRGAREQERQRKRLEEIKVTGRQPAPPQTVGAKDARKSSSGELAAAPPRDEFEEEKPAPGPVLVLPEAAAEAARKKGGVEPKIAHGATNFRLPSAGLLRMAEKSEKVQEDELKECALCCRLRGGNGHRVPRRATGNAGRRLHGHGDGDFGIVDPNRHGFIDSPVVS